MSSIQTDTDNILKQWPVEQQYELAKTLAANCGYQLIEAEESERSIEIKNLIEVVRNASLFIEDEKMLLVEGLEALLK